MMIDLVLAILIDRSQSCLCLFFGRAIENQTIEK